MSYKKNDRTRGIDLLDLPPAKAQDLRVAMHFHHYGAAERILINAITVEGGNQQKCRLLNYLGGVYYFDGDYLHAAVAWSRSAAIAPLNPTIQFSLAMAYIEINHRGWAEQSIQELAMRFPRNPLYPYWLGRIAYDKDHYSQCVSYFTHAIKLNPLMSIAYNNLGLCYFYSNEDEKAILAYKKAILLNAAKKHSSAWPYLNLAIAQELLNRPQAAEINLQKSIHIDPEIPQAYFELGNIFEHQNKLQQSIAFYRHAAQLSPEYAQPHFSLARVYERLGDRAKANAEVKIYMRLKREDELLNVGNSAK